MVRITALAMLVLFAAIPARAGPRIVAAETVYADIARQLAGPDADITAILTNPAEDPHLFEVTPAVARGLTGAAIVIYNGAGYDPWMRDLLAATAAGGPRQVIDVADLVHAGSGGNPHLWFAPATIPALAVRLARALQTAEADQANAGPADAGQAAAVTQRLATVQAALAVLAGKIAAFRARHAGQAVVATEPVFGLMVQALGLQDRDPDFERAAMNDTEPSASSVAALEDDLRRHRAGVLLRNVQTDSAATRRIVALAEAAHVPIVTVSEFEPRGVHYQDWVAGILAELDRALGKRR